jgi:uncharacterized protein (DUF4213/DUF364 family)
MKIARKLLEKALDLAWGKRVERVEVGRYSAVRLDDGGVGLALNELSPAERQEMKSLVGRPASEILELLRSDSSGWRSLGLACANALFNRPGKGEERGDVLDFMLVGREDRVGMVGCFRPIIDKLRSRCGELLVFEREDQREDFLLPAEKAYRLLPACRVAIITASALVNGTLDGLLEVCREVEQVALVGPSTALCPEVFRNTAVKLLCGAMVTEPERVLERVAAGEGMPAFKGMVEKVCMKL